MAVEMFWEASFYILCFSVCLQQKSILYLRLEELFFIEETPRFYK